MKQHSMILLAGYNQRRGGVSLIVHNVAELRAGLCAAFEPATVARWETTDWRAVWRGNDPS